MEVNPAENQPVPEVSEETNLHKRPPQQSEKIDESDWVCVQGVQKFMKDFEILRTLKKLFDIKECGITELIKEKNKPFFFMRFESLGKKEEFLPKFPFTIKNRKCKARDASFSKGTLRKSRTVTHIEEFMDKKRESHKEKEVDSEFLRTVTPQSLIEMMQQRICGYNNVDYSEQIERKKAELLNFLEEIKKVAVKDAEELGHCLSWITSEKPQCCELKDFIECEEDWRKYYRNKNEFTIGTCLLENKQKVGFNISENAHNFHSVCRGDSFEDTVTCPKEAYEIAKITEGFIQTSEIPVYSRFTNEGFWRNLVVRQSPYTKQLLVNLVVSKKHFPEGNFEQDFIAKFKTYFEAQILESSILSEFKLAGFTLQNSESTSDSIPYIEDSDLELLLGEGKVYHEKICGNTFEISNSSFLQINSHMMDKMYNYVGQLADLNEDTILLDICSGIGTIGLSVGKRCKKVIGIEMVQSACDNAKKNAEMCGMKYEVICGKVEDVIAKVVEENQGSRLVGIVDPPRAGLHHSVAQALRTCKGLDEMIFMACDVKQSKVNIVDLCAPSNNKKRKGPAFSPLHAIGVDMFPNTPHFETIFHLKRLYE